MKNFAKVLIGLSALVHLLFLAAEMFLWQTDFVQGRVDKFPTEQVAAILAGNQGLYNGFLAAGLIWGFLDKQQSKSIWTFFLVCAAIAGVYGSLTLKSPYPFLLQTLLAAIALLIVWNSKGFVQPEPEKRVIE